MVIFSAVLRDTIIKQKVKLHGLLAEHLLLECKNILHLEKEGIGEARQSWGLGGRQVLPYVPLVSVTNYNKLGSLK